MTALGTAFFKPSTWRAPVQAARTLWFDYAHVRSAAETRPVDAHGQPVPWYTYPAIEYLRQLDFRDKEVFEYGSGQSTLFWASSARRVVSVEEDDRWHAYLAKQLPANCKLILETDLGVYPEVIERYADGFDIIVVDGAARGRTRLKCSRVALRCLRAGGLIILDNSDWLPESARLLRESGLLQVDMTGFAPGNGHTQTTSLFFHREFQPKPKHDRLPLPGPGAADKNWERFSPPEAPWIAIGDDTLNRVDRDRTVEFEVSGGRRRFRVLGGYDSATSGRWSALVDEDQQRVVMYLPASEDPEQIERAVNDAGGNWSALQSWVHNHDRRRFVL